MDADLPLAEFVVSLFLLLFTSGDSRIKPVAPSRTRTPGMKELLGQALSHTLRKAFREPPMGVSSSLAAELCDGADLSNSRFVWLMKVRLISGVEPTLSPRAAKRFRALRF
jgi:hypothetical protein